MSTFNQFAGGAATTSITNAYSGGGVASANPVAASVNSNMGKEVLSGALTANALATILSVTGSGEIPFLTAYTKDATSRTVRLKVTVDGTSVFDATSAATTTVGAGIVVVGEIATASFPVQAGLPLRFNASLLIQIASSVSETDKVAIGYVLHKR
ncbi:hypothetical protein [Roseateles sp. P5_E11]